MKLKSYFKIFISVFLISFLIFVIVGFVRKKRIINKEIVCSFDDEFECEVEKLLLKSSVPYFIFNDGTVLHVSYGQPIDPDPNWVSEYEYEQQLVKLGGKAVPILIELIKKFDKNNPKDRFHRETAIYVLGRIGGEQSVEFLNFLIQSQEEDFAAKAYAKKALKNIKDMNTTLKY